MNLHEKIAARLDELQAIAHTAAAGKEHWEYRPISVYMSGESSGTIRPVPGGPMIAPMFGRFGEHVEAWDPATVLRVLAHYRKTLTRHGGSSLDPRSLCLECGWNPANPRPCVELVDLAEALRIEVES